LNRRDLLILGGTAIGWPLAARAQQTAMPVIGYLGTTPGVPAEFFGGLSETGYVEGKNVAIEYRSADGHYDRLPSLAAELVNRQVQVLVAGTLPAALAAQAATQTIPIVFWSGGDPVEQGLVASLNRPGGNLTGVGMFNNNLGAKRLELLLEIVPKAAVVAFLVNPTNRSTEAQTKEVQAAANAKGAQLHVLDASNEAEIDATFAALGNLHADALMVGSDVYLYDQREQVVALAAKYAVPAIYSVREYANVGGLRTATREPVFQSEAMPAGY
jgi:putative ABC transport system substrate-binding protein